MPPKTQQEEKTIQEQEASADSGALTIFKPNTAVSKLPAHLQAALSKFRTREAAGFAPQWKPEKPGEFILGTVMSYREGVETEFGPATVVTFQTQDGPKAVFLSTELKRKLEDAPKGSAWVIQYEGKQLKKDNPKLKNDMKTFTVIEVLPPEE